MRLHRLLPIVALLTIGAYSCIAMATSGAASLAASPMLFAAIAMMLWHDRVAETA